MKSYKPIYQSILTQQKEKRKLLAVLLDPEKCDAAQIERLTAQFQLALPDFIFIGGSSRLLSTDDLLEKLAVFPVPKILFPGDASQFSTHADAILFLSLISGRNPDYLIEQHVQSGLKIKHSGIEVISTGYVLIDGKRASAVQRVSKTDPIPANDVDTIVKTAVAGELLGMKMIYLEAGSGATEPVALSTIEAVKRELDIPLIVGGGIRSVEQMQAAHACGADVVVIGNYFEEKPEKLKEFLSLL